MCPGTDPEKKSPEKRKIAWYRYRKKKKVQKEVDGVIPERKLIFIHVWLVICDFYGELEKLRLV